MKIRYQIISYLLITIFVALALFFSPIVPSAYIIKYGSIDLNVMCLGISLDQNDKNQIRSVIRKEGHYGRAEVPKYVSMNKYLNNKVGVLKIRQTAENTCHQSKKCNFEVTTGFDCGPVCGHGAVFHVEKIDIDWSMSYHSSWVH